MQYNVFFYREGGIVKLYNKSVSFLLIIVFFQSFAAQQAAVSISTTQDAIVMLRKIIINTPDGDGLVLQDYEQKQSSVVVQCAKVLYDTTYAQILEALQEIDNRLMYWRGQKNHPWIYFVTKSPMKWVTGSSQDEEVNNNIEQLQSHQGELYVFLGQLAEFGNVYVHKYKTVFRTDYIQAYAWVDGLLDALGRIKVSIKNIDDMSPFIARVTVLKAKLEKVRFFKNQILSEIKETQIPAHLERNWLKYGAVGLLLGFGYQNISFEQIKNSLDALKNSFMNYIVDPVESIIKDVFVHTGTEGLLVSRENIDVIKKSIENFVNNSSISADEKQKIVEDIMLGNSGSFQAFVDSLASSWNIKKTAEGKTLLYEFLTLQAAGRTQKQISGVAKIAVLTPALLSNWFAYRGYQALTLKDYTSIGRALVDINSLFVDATRPLDDEQYGKMLYLVYDLKKRAAKDVPLSDRVEFINDLNRVESKEFNVAAKRAIVEDMFRKYSFLKLT